MEAIDRLKLRLTDIHNPAPDDELLEQLLIAAGEIIVDYRFPFGGYTIDDSTGLREVPAKYEGLQVDIAIELYSKLGAEGQVVHRENGIDRYYAASLISPDLLRRITPLAKLI